MGQKKIGRIIKEGETNATPSVNVTKSTKLTYPTYLELSGPETKNLLKEFDSIIAKSRTKRDTVIKNTERDYAVQVYSTKSLRKVTVIWNYILQKYVYSNIEHYNNMYLNSFLLGFCISKEPEVAMFVLTQTYYANMSKDTEITSKDPNFQLDIGSDDIKLLKYMLRCHNLAVHAFYLTHHMKNFVIKYDEESKKLFIVLK
jgi:hypothetical protein